MSIQVENLCIDFTTEFGQVRAVDGLGFTLQPGETVGLVGESGCGKSVTALAMLNLLPRNGRLAEGCIRLGQKYLNPGNQHSWKHVAGTEISMIFQDPMTSLDPVFTIGNQLLSVISRARGQSKKKATQTALQALQKVDLPEPQQCMDSYPHELSGGMRQRVMIAMAIACQPKILIADEPTTALDVTTQAQVLSTLQQVQRDTDMATLLITHDLGVAAQVCDRIMVMYCGQLVEQATTTELFAHPRHPYTHGLLAAIPKLRQHKQARLTAIAGQVPALHQIPAGCRFSNRCPQAADDCRRIAPDLSGATGRHQVRCLYPLQEDTVALGGKP